MLQDGINMNAVFNLKINFYCNVDPLKEDKNQYPQNIVTGSKNTHSPIQVETHKSVSQ